jgi:hypothetical protein
VSSLFFWNVAPRHCVIGAGRLETTLEDETATLSRTADTRNTVVRRHIQKKGDLKLSASIIILFLNL